MSSPTMRTLVERYLVERRRLGFDLRKSAYALRSFACHVGAVGHRGPLTVEIMADWARCDSHGSTDPRTWARRLKLLRSFTRWLQQFEPRTEIPDDAIFGRLAERQAPHIYSEQEFVDLLAAARRLGPAPGLRGVVFETLFGLIGSCGLRVSEAVGLRNMDVDLEHGMLTIHRTKFGKSRQVPMHRSCVEALRHYRSMRDLSGESVQDEAAFFVGTRGQRRGMPLSTHGVERGLRGLVYETLFGLIASCGLRLSEALKLNIGDVDFRRGVLTIRRTKFAKSRQVPLHPSTAKALGRYRWTRDVAGASRDDDAPFFIGTRGRLFGKPISVSQVDNVFAKLRIELAWINRGTHHAPRIHDLRHTFVVRRILLWQQQGIDVDEAMLSLSTYVGHAMVTNTYWYLQAVPELMAVAAQRFESCMPELSHV